MYANGFCPTSADGTKLACPNAYGALIGTAAVCSLLEIALAFVSPKLLQKIFPPIVTGPTVMLIGVSLIEIGFQAWAGGSGPCNAMPKDGFFKLCPNILAPHAMVWGSASFIGMFLGYQDLFLLLMLTRLRTWILGFPNHPSLREIWFANHEVIQRHLGTSRRLYRCGCLRIL
jgi:xanthine/uracil permease